MPDDLLGRTVRLRCKVGRRYTGHVTTVLDVTQDGCLTLGTDDDRGRVIELTGVDPAAVELYHRFGINHAEVGFLVELLQRAEEATDNLQQAASCRRLWKRLVKLLA